MYLAPYQMHERMKASSIGTDAPALYINLPEGQQLFTFAGISLYDGFTCLAGAVKSPP